MVLKRILTTFLFINLPYFLFSQSYFPILEQNPSSLKWRKIQISNTPYTLVFNQNSDSLAQITANYIHQNYLDIGKGLHVSNMRSWPIIIQNQGLVSNGFVSLNGPRVEFYSTKPQNSSLLSINNWQELLTSHELRHVYQNEMSRKGLGKLSSWLFGNSLLSAASTLYIPNWLFEGDAVETETRLNPTGRSKIPQFYMPLYAYLNEYGVPSYAKLMAKSYRELVPNHYVFGQALSQSFIRQFGQESIDQLWTNTFSKMKLFSFSNSVKKLSGKKIDDYSFELFSKLKDFASAFAKRSADSILIRTPKIKKGFTQYDFPQWIDHETFISLKTGLGEIPQIVKMTKNKEVKLVNLGPKVDDGMLSANKDWVVFSELQFHPRWAQKQGSRIVFYDLKKEQKSYWDIGLKWMSPSISSDSKYLSLLQQNANGSSEIIIFDFNTQEIINSYPLGLNTLAIQPRISDHQQLVFIELKENRKKIIVWDWKNNAVSAELNLGQNNGAYPYLKDNKVFFNLPQNGVDQLACWDIRTQKINQLTNSIWGAYHASPDESGQNILYSNYTAKGLQVVEKKMDSLTSFQLETPKLEVEKSQKEMLTYSSTQFRQLFNFYNWGPLAMNQNNSLDISISSKNVLNTFQFGAGLLYNANERNWGQFLKFSVQKWYPVFDFSFVRTNRSTSLYLDKNLPLDSLRTDNWKQNKLDFGIRLPFNLTHSAYQENLTVIQNYSFMNVEGYQLPARYTTEAFDGTYFSTIHQINYYKLLGKSALDVQSRKGYSMSLYWQSMPKAQSIKAELWAIQARIYLPGMGPHDGLSFRYSYQQQMKGNYYYASPIQIPRGDVYRNYEQYHVYSIDYKFPIANSDLNLGKWAYFKRFKGNVFFDQGFGINYSNAQKSQVNFQSFGVDLSSQISFMRFSQTVELGVRCLFKPQTQNVEVYPLIMEIGF